jgi:hypothetical protein
MTTSPGQLGRSRSPWTLLVLLAGYALVLAGVTFVMGAVTDVVSYGENPAHAVFAGILSLVTIGAISLPFFGLFGVPALMASVLVVRRVGTTALRAAIAGAITWAAWFGFLAGSAAANGFVGPDFPTSAFWLPVWIAAGAMFGIWTRRTRATNRSRDIAAR